MAKMIKNSGEFIWRKLRNVIESLHNGGTIKASKYHFYMNMAFCELYTELKHEGRSDKVCDNLQLMLNYYELLYYCEDQITGEKLNIPTAVKLNIPTFDLATIDS